jgi:hypothetical protein
MERLSGIGHAQAFLNNPAEAQRCVI